MDHRRGGDPMDEETIAMRRSRRVSFADTTAIHVFERDDDSTDTPSFKNDSMTFPYVSGSKSAGERDGSDTSSPIEGDEDEDGGPDAFIKDMIDSSPGSASAASLASNDDDNFFGPVSAKFLKSGRFSDTGMSEDCDNNGNHDITLDSTAFSLHFHNIKGELTSNSVGLTQTGFSTLGTARSTEPNRTETLVKSSNRMSDFSLIGSNSKYEFANFTSTLDGLLNEVEENIISPTVENKSQESSILVTETSIRIDEDKRVDENYQEENSQQTLVKDELTANSVGLTPTVSFTEQNRTPVANKSQESPILVTETSVRIDEDKRVDENYQEENSQQTLVKDELTANSVGLMPTGFSSLETVSLTEQNRTETSVKTSNRMSDFSVIGSDSKYKFVNFTPTLDGLLNEVEENLITPVENKSQESPIHGIEMSAPVDNEKRVDENKQKDNSQQTLVKDELTSNSIGLTPTGFSSLGTVSSTEPNRTETFVKSSNRMSDFSMIGSNSKYEFANFTPTLDGLLNDVEENLISPPEENKSQESPIHGIETSARVDREKRVDENYEEKVEDLHNADNSKSMCSFSPQNVTTVNQSTSMQPQLQVEKENENENETILHSPKEPVAREQSSPGPNSPLRAKSNVPFSPQTQVQYESENGNENEPTSHVPETPVVRAQPSPGSVPSLRSKNNVSLFPQNLTSQDQSSQHQNANENESPIHFIEMSADNEEQVDENDQDDIEDLHEAAIQTGNVSLSPRDLTTENQSAAQVVHEQFLLSPISSLRIESNVLLPSQNLTTQDQSTDTPSQVQYENENGNDNEIILDIPTEPVVQAQTSPGSIYSLGAKSNVALSPQNLTARDQSSSSQSRLPNQNEDGNPANAPLVHGESSPGSISSLRDKNFSFSPKNASAQNQSASTVPELQSANETTLPALEGPMVSSPNSISSLRAKSNVQLSPLNETEQVQLLRENENENGNEVFLDNLEEPVVRAQPSPGSTSSSRAKSIASLSPRNLTTQNQPINTQTPLQPKNENLNESLNLNEIEIETETENEIKNENENENEKQVDENNQKENSQQTPVKVELAANSIGLMPTGFSSLGTVSSTEPNRTETFVQSSNRMSDFSLTGSNSKYEFANFTPTLDGLLNDVEENSISPPDDKSQESPIHAIETSARVDNEKRFVENYDEEVGNLHDADNSKSIFSFSPQNLSTENQSTSMQPQLQVEKENENENATILHSPKEPVAREQSSPGPNSLLRAKRNVPFSPQIQAQYESENGNENEKTSHVPETPVVRAQPSPGSVSSLRGKNNVLLSRQNVTTQDQSLHHQNANETESPIHVIQMSARADNEKQVDENVQDEIEDLHEADNQTGHVSLSPRDFITVNQSTSSQSQLQAEKENEDENETILFGPKEPVAYGQSSGGFDSPLMAKTTIPLSPQNVSTEIQVLAENENGNVNKIISHSPEAQAVHEQSLPSPISSLPIQVLSSQITSQDQSTDTPSEIQLEPENDNESKYGTPKAEVVSAQYSSRSISSSRTKSNAPFSPQILTPQNQPTITQSSLQTETESNAPLPPENRTTKTQLTSPQSGSQHEQEIQTMLHTPKSPAIQAQSLPSPISSSKAKSNAPFSPQILTPQNQPTSTQSPLQTETESNVPLSPQNPSTKTQLMSPQSELQRQQEILTMLHTPKSPAIHEQSLPIPISSLPSKRKSPFSPEKLATQNQPTHTLPPLHEDKDENENAVSLQTPKAPVIQTPPGSISSFLEKSSVQLSRQNLSARDQSTSILPLLQAENENKTILQSPEAPRVHVQSSPVSISSKCSVAISPENVTAQIQLEPENDNGSKSGTPKAEVVSAQYSPRSISSSKAKSNAPFSPKILTPQNQPTSTQSPLQTETESNVPLSPQNPTTKTQLASPQSGLQHEQEIQTMLRTPKFSAIHAQSSPSPISSLPSKRKSPFSPDKLTTQNQPTHTLPPLHEDEDENENAVILETPKAPVIQAPSLQSSIASLRDKRAKFYGETGLILHQSIDSNLLKHEHRISAIKQSILRNTPKAKVLSSRLNFENEDFDSDSRKRKGQEILVENVEDSAMKRSRIESGNLRLVSNLSDIMKMIFSPDIRKLTYHEIDLLQSKLEKLQMARNHRALFASLKNCDSNSTRQERLSEVRSLHDTLVFEKAKLELKRLKLNKLQIEANIVDKRVQECSLLKSRIQKLCPPIDNFLPIVSNSIPQEEQDKLNAKRHAFKTLEENVKRLATRIQVSCKLKENLSSDETIRIAKGHLRQRSLCRALHQDSRLWVLQEVVNKDHTHDIVLSYHKFLLQRFTFGTGKLSEILGNNSFCKSKISEAFRNINAFSAFDFVFSERIGDHKIDTLKYIWQVPMETGLLLGNLLNVLYEVQQAKMELLNLISAKFNIKMRDTSSKLELQMSFVNFRTCTKINLSQDMSDLKCAVYPCEPSELQIEVDRVGTILDEVAISDIMDSIRSLEVGPGMILRLCRVISLNLA